MHLTGLIVNYTKSDLIKLHLNFHKTRGSSDTITQITIENQILICKASKDHIHYLGIWIQVNGLKQYQQKLMEKKINFILAALRKVKIINKQCRYIINQVLYPQLEYLSTNYIPPLSWLNSHDQKIYNTFKTKCNLSKTILNSIIHSQIGYKFFNIKDQIYWQVLMNSQI